jgi:hypothetical protein
MSPVDNRRQVEELWRQRVAHARARYDAASKAFRETWGEHFEKEPLSADPTLAIRKAREVESAALAEYMRVLKIYTRLVLDGVLPDDQRDGGP